jgi:superfamily II DNA or RNA helicase
VLPSDDFNIVKLRPISGGEKEIAGVHRKLAELGIDIIKPARFPLPDLSSIRDYISIQLLFNGARLSLRDGAGPFRSLARVSVRPRPYQFLPLLMALKIDPIRMLIADDVGVGKTIEALLIAREMLDRGEIQRLCVLCPPYLCSQWQQEMKEKFNIYAEIISPGTISQLQRKMPHGDLSIFKYFPYIIVSIDFAKSERRRDNFIVNCPEFVIVDEVHGAAEPPSQQKTQQQRHELLKRLSEDSERHFLMLTATPHSGVESSFLSILGLIEKNFSRLNLNTLKEKERENLARHFIQRKRQDVKKWLDEETHFPERQSLETVYELSNEYKNLFQDVFDFSRELVKSGEELTGWKRRIRYWTALSLLRCVMSSPAAASAALLKKAETIQDSELEDDSYSPYVYESTEEESTDAQPSHIVQQSRKEIRDTDQRKLRSFSKSAENIIKNRKDKKLIKCTDNIRDLLKQGKHPIIWCRYIATSDYVASQIQESIKKDITSFRAVSITGALAEEERQERILELIRSTDQYALVATDCLSEGINLQDNFDAVIHYDLPWNPNRMEQREGRVDRFGQTAEKVQAILLYCRDNPIDGAVLEVLLRKAREIHKSLGVSVPIPMKSEEVMNTIINALFFKGKDPQQLSLFEEQEVNRMHKEWERSADREKESRTRFAQHSIKPQEVQQEIESTDEVLGDPDAVKKFIFDAAYKLNFDIKENSNNCFSIYGIEELPPILKNSIPEEKTWKVSFHSPPPKGADYLGRNHPFINTLAQYVLEQSLSGSADSIIGRSSVVRTDKVDALTQILLLRLRFLIEEPGENLKLAEEVITCGYEGSPVTGMKWLSENETKKLFLNITSEISVSENERKELVQDVLDDWSDLQEDLQGIIENRSDKLEEAHKRIRQAAKIKRRGFKVKPHTPPDLIGVLILTPMPKGREQ